ncbi:MAG: MOSC domain-containing protein [Kofleriaceae bacterium]|nr:MOSC domain-containing protein [Kofleriaceae bacterium]
MTGRIFQLNVSSGGVPKLPIREVRVERLGLAGDRHAHPKLHGGLSRAVCLLSLELIQQLQAEGHPIWPGSTGENVTFSGIDFMALAVGMRLALGDDVIVQLTRTTEPCKVIAGSFRDHDFRRFDHAKHPNITRWYASVEREGSICVGQPIRIL